jgi:hypothetical protein
MSVPWFLFSVINDKNLARICMVGATMAPLYAEPRDDVW